MIAVLPTVRCSRVTWEAQRDGLLDLDRRLGRARPYRLARTRPPLGHRRRRHRNSTTAWASMFSSPALRRHQPLGARTGRPRCPIGHRRVRGGFRFRAVGFPLSVSHCRFPAVGFPRIRGKPCTPPIKFDRRSDGFVREVVLVGRRACATARPTSPCTTTSMVSCRWAASQRRTIQRRGYGRRLRGRSRAASSSNGTPARRSGR